MTKSYHSPLSHMPNLSKIFENTLSKITLVKISANWSSDLILDNSTIFLSNFSLMKNQPTSTCFVQSCWTGLRAILCAVLLSQYIQIDCLDELPKSSKRNLSHNALQILSVIPLYSASALERATTFYFLLLHVTRFPHTNVKYPEVDHLSSFAPA